MFIYFNVISMVKWQCNCFYHWKLLGGGCNGTPGFNLLYYLIPLPWISVKQPSDPILPLPFSRIFTCSAAVHHNFNSGKNQKWAGSFKVLCFLSSPWDFLFFLFTPDVKHEALINSSIFTQCFLFSNAVVLSLRFVQRF